MRVVHPQMRSEPLGEKRWPLSWLFEDTARHWVSAPGFWTFGLPELQEMEVCCWAFQSAASLLQWPERTETGVVEEAVLLLGPRLLLLLPASSDALNSACHVTERRFDPWIRKVPWRWKWQPTQVFLPGKFHKQEELGELKSMESQSVGHNWTPEHQTISRYWMNGWGLAWWMICNGKRARQY